MYALTDKPKISLYSLDSKSVSTIERSNQHVRAQSNIFCSLLGKHRIQFSFILNRDEIRINFNLNTKKKSLKINSNHKFNQFCAFYLNVFTYKHKNMLYY